MSATKPTPVYYVRADRNGWDWHNIFSAPFKELLEYRALIQLIVSRDLKVRYKRSILGIAWTLLAPLMSMLVLWAVFTQALKVSIPYYATYLLSGIIVWNLFLQSSQAGAQSIMASVGLLKKVRLPRSLFPLTTVVNNGVNFTFAFGALLIVMIVSRTPFHFTILLVPVAMIPAFLFCMGWAMMVSALAVFFRDLQYILEIALGALFYLTPILYEPAALPEKVRWIVSLNPIAKFIFLFRQVVYIGELPEVQTYLVALATGLVMFLIGWVIFQRLQKRFIYWL